MGPAAGGSRAAHVGASPVGRALRPFDPVWHEKTTPYDTVRKTAR